jgi:hypothetical protein
MACMKNNLICHDVKSSTLCIFMLMLLYVFHTLKIYVGGLVAHVHKKKIGRHFDRCNKLIINKGNTWTNNIYTYWNNENSLENLHNNYHQILESFNVHFNTTIFEMFYNFGSNFPHIFINGFSFIDCIRYSCFLNVQYYYSWPR